MDDLTRQAAESAVRSLIERTARLGDTGAAEDYVQVYGTEAVWESGGDRDEGLSAIIESARARRQHKVSGPGTNTGHEVTVLRIDFDDAEHARVQSRFRFLRDVATTPTVAAAGSYDDRVEVEDGEWKISRRSARSAEPE